MATELTEIIGLPPMQDDNTFGANNKIIDSMPIATIKPAIITYVPGLSTMTIDIPAGMELYNTYLIAHEYILGSNEGLKLAFQADSFPSDSFTNSYSEGFLQDYSKGLSRTASTVMQTLGGRNAVEGVSKAAGAIGKTAKEYDMNMISGFANTVSKGADKFDKMIKNKNVFKNDAANNILSIASSVAGGGRIDFPQIWDDSSFSPSYTMTVRLYNPNPADPTSTDKYIIGPIAAIMLLGIPLSDDTSGSTYNRPFLHEITCPGIYYLNPCFISNITVIKGGDQQQIAYNQQLGIVDIRIDFGSLYSSMLASTSDTEEHRPTLKSYLSSMRGEKTLLYVEEEETEETEETEGETEIESEGEEPSTRDSDPDLTYSLYEGIVLTYGSLYSAVVENDEVIYKNIAEQLLANGVITQVDFDSVPYD